MRERRCERVPRRGLYFSRSILLQVCIGKVHLKRRCILAPLPLCLSPVVSYALTRCTASSRTLHARRSKSAFFVELIDGLSSSGRRENLSFNPAEQRTSPIIPFSGGKMLLTRLRKSGTRISRVRTRKERALLLRAEFSTLHIRSLHHRREPFRTLVH